MPTSAKTLLRFVREIAGPAAGAEGDDAALVRRFIADGDGHAFSVLVKRHGPLVLQACRRILGDGEDAEDAFQATFLVLARKARSVQPYVSLAHWLYAVARRVSLKARTVRARRWRLEMATRHERTPAHDPLKEVSGRELLAIIDEEVERLPEKQQLAILLCCFQGLSLEEAAARLGWKAGAVKGHLQRGRCRLHARLVRRGLTLTAALAAVEASRGLASTAAVAALASAYSHGARGPAVRGAAPAPDRPTAAAELARAVLRDSGRRKLAVATGLLVPVLLVAAGFAWRAGRQTPADDATASDAKFVPSGTAVAARPAELTDEDDVPITVSGRVLDPAGKPFAGAGLYVGYSFISSTVGSGLPVPQAALPLRARSDAHGRFQFTFSRSELDPEMLDDAGPAVIVVANGYGPEWSPIAGAGPAEVGTLRLIEDVPVSGRVLDPKGNAVAGATIRVLSLDSASEADVTGYLRDVDPTSTRLRRWRGAFPERPAEVTSDRDGRFRLTGLGRDRIATLLQDGPAHVSQPFLAVARPTATAPEAHFRGAHFDLVTADTRLVRGVCRDRATGQPVAGVRVGLRDSDQRTRVTDANGRFELPVRSNATIRVDPASGQPYLSAAAAVPKAAGDGPITLEFDLDRGIPVVGHVLAPPGMKPPRGGRVEYYSLAPDADAGRPLAARHTPLSTGRVQPDGSFQLVVRPGRGAVAVDASPKRAFAIGAIDEQALRRFFPGAKVSKGPNGMVTLSGSPRCWLTPPRYNAVSLIDPGEATPSLALDVRLTAAVRRHGGVLGPEGQPVEFVRVAGLTARHNVEVLDGPFFEVSDMGPNEIRQVAFLHPEKKLGKLLAVDSNDAGPLEVRLERCGTVTGRFVNERGQPLPNAFAYFYSGGVGTNDAIIMSDENGRFEKLVVPGMKYTIQVRPPRPGVRGVVADVQLDPGQVRDLGDLTRSTAPSPH